MAIVLGNFNENKAVKLIKEKTANNVRIETIKELISLLNEQVELAQDIYDTFWHIEKQDKEFSEKLWKLLCRNKIAEIDINSYFAWKVGYEGYVMLSRHGISIYNSRIKGDLLKKFDLNENEIYRGRVLLEDYLNKCEVNNDILDKMIADLQVFLTNFKQYANDFFQSVSSYNVKIID